MRQGSRSDVPSAFGSAGGVRCADRPAARRETPCRRQMIVLGPAGNIGPGQRRVLAAVDLKRSFEPGYGRWRTGRRMRRLLRTCMTCRNGIHRSERARQSDHAEREPRQGLAFSGRASGANQLPVRIARARVAGECPDIGDIGDLIGIAIDDSPGLVAGDRNHLRHEAYRQLRRPVAGFRAHQLGLVDRNKPRFGLLLVASRDP